MKKLIITLALVIAAVTAGAQEFANTPRIGRNNFFFSVLDHIGWGIAMPESADASGDAFVNATSFGKNREFFMNIATLEFTPYPTGHLSIGADIDWSNYRLDKTHYWDSSTANSVSVASADGLYSTVKTSRLRVFSFVFPLDYTQRIGPVSITVGAGGELNLPASNKFKGADTADATVKSRVRGIDTESFTYNFHAVVSYYGWGLYVKYRPVPQFVNRSGPLFTSWTAGLYFR